MFRLFPLDYILRLIRLSVIKRADTNRAFTLIELLIVIGILAVLAGAVVIVINPAEMFAGARDTQRLSDAESLSKVVSIAQINNISLGTVNTVYVSMADTLGDCSNLGLPTLPTPYVYKCVTTANLRNINGTGWIPINFNLLSTGSPIATLPIDPTNAVASGLYYTYVTTGTQYLVTAIPESQREKTLLGTNYLIQGYPDVIVTGTGINISPLFNTNGLVGYWPFEGSPNDTSGNNNNGTWYGAQIGGSYYTGGKIGQAGNFNGIDDKILFPTTAIVPTNSSITVAAWVYLTSNPGTRFIARWYGSDDSARDGSIQLAGTYGFFVRNAALAQTTISSSVGTLNQWVYLTGVWNQSTGTVSMYVNGAQTSGSLSGPAEVSTSQPILMNSADSSNKFISGKVDDLRVYNRALSDAEVKALYNAQK